MLEAGKVQEAVRLLRKAGRLDLLQEGVLASVLQEVAGLKGMQHRQIMMLAMRVEQLVRAGPICQGPASALVAALLEWSDDEGELGGMEESIQDAVESQLVSVKPPAKVYGRQANGKRALAGSTGKSHRDRGKHDQAWGVGRQHQHKMTMIQQPQGEEMAGPWAASQTTTGSGAHACTGRIKESSSVSRDGRGSATASVPAQDRQQPNMDEWWKGLSMAFQWQPAEDHSVYAEVLPRFMMQAGTSGLYGSEEVQQTMLDYGEESMEEGELREENEEQEMEGNWWQGREGSRWGTTHQNVGGRRCSEA
ncbi:hypothetical protein NDU88_001400 [Pleurodeles waltl]|uniref:Uncharacterized protein n=1 Tax=Pleurodeles waltl TaxID=8319 RepID=A0AAV7WI80_PLEWA|nr:hypothetical protein NDU88_001400 [Pleurodeles waltl]